MKSSKTLTSAVVAAALVGGIGLAYAQTQDPSQSMQPAPMQQMQPAAPGAGTMANQPSTDAAATPSTDTSFQAERPAQADRN